jgi:lysophospholipase
MLDAPFFADLADGPPGGAALWFHATDGVRLRAGYWPGGAKGTVLLIPGRTEYIEKYGPAAGDLAARGYATLCIDVRGQGLADRLMDDPLKGHVAGFADYQLDMQALLALARQIGCVEPFFLLSHSMGGAIGLRSLLAGMPLRAAAFSAPMWGVQVPIVTRPFAHHIARIMTVIGRGLTYAPTTGAVPYVQRVGFAGNTLTTDRGMWDTMVAHLAAQPMLSLGGPTVTWLEAAFAECRDLARMPSPTIPCYCAVGTGERIVAVQPIKHRMARWPGGTLDIFPGAEHEVMMERPATRKRFFDAVAALFDANRYSGLQPT